MNRFVCFRCVVSNDTVLWKCPLSKHVVSRAKFSAGQSPHSFYFPGYPSELFYRGSTMWETLYGMVLAYPIVCFIFVPVYFSLGITSVYQYLDLRFKSRLVRCLASATYVIRQLLNQGVTVFTPCVALNTVIGIPYWASIVGITFVSIVFTILVSASRIEDYAGIKIKIFNVPFMSDLKENSGRNLIKTHYIFRRVSPSERNNKPTSLFLLLSRLKEKREAGGRRIWYFPVEQL